MRLCDIETFLAIAESRSMTQAANTLFVSQSTISHRLKKLEDELGFVLIARQRGLRNVELTQKGEDFIPLARQWQRLWHNTNCVRLASQEFFLSVAGPDSVNAHLLFPLYEKLATMDNPLNLQVLTLPSSEIYTALNNGEIDTGFVFQQLRYKNILCKPVFHEEIHIVCKSGSPYGSGPLHPSKLDPQNEILLPWSNDFQRWHDTWWNPAINPLVYVDSVSLLLNFMSSPSSKHYWAACPECVTHYFRGNTNIEVHELSVSPPSRVCYMLEHRNPKHGRIHSIEVSKKHLEPFLAKYSFTRREYLID